MNPRSLIPPDRAGPRTRRGGGRRAGAPAADAFPAAFGRPAAMYRLAVLLALALTGLAGCGGGGGDDPGAGPVEVRAETTALANRPAGPDGVAAAAATGTGASAPAEESGLVIRRQPQGVQAREGGVAEFSVEVDGPGRVSYQWLRDDESIDGETGPVLRLPVTAADHLARFRVEIRAGSARMQSLPALLRVGAG
jgi:hypothetical protein